MQPRKLEHYKYFQPVAWTVCLGFAGYVGMLALNLDKEIDRLENSSLSFEQRLQNLEQAVSTSTPN
jgi:hypothetical protein